MFVQVCFQNIRDDYDTEISRFHLKARPSFEWDVNDFFLTENIFTQGVSFNSARLCASSGVMSVKFSNKMFLIEKTYKTFLQNPFYCHF